MAQLSVKGVGGWGVEWRFGDFCSFWRNLSFFVPVAFFWNGFKFTIVFSCDSIFCVLKLVCYRKSPICCVINGVNG